MAELAPPRPSRRKRASGGRAPRRLLWAGLSAPAMLWLLVLFVVPFYVALAVAGGQINQIIGTPLPAWNPLDWSGAAYRAVFHEFSGTGAFLGPVVLRTLLYVGIAALLSLLIGYPAAYFVSRFAGKQKGILLGLLLAPFWVSYMMRMLAWIDLLQTDGYVNRVLVDLHLVSHPVVWLGGKATTVILGLVYGYIPYLILVLYAGLDRIDGALIEAGRDLGLGRVRTFMRVTLPLSRQAILTGLLVTVLPMLGDYFTNQMLSGATNTAMIGNTIDTQLSSTTLQTQGASLSLMMLGVLVIPMLYYVIATNRASMANA
ncbi:MAG TPA: ABC transporter permease [Mycobacteriales bacterium]|nr:ABC transporter permease [Mycobacteriales bacterium]